MDKVLLDSIVLATIIIILHIILYLVKCGEHTRHHWTFYVYREFVVRLLIIIFSGASACITINFIKDIKDEKITSQIDYRWLFTIVAIYGIIIIWHSIKIVCIGMEITHS